MMFYCLTLCFNLKRWAALAPWVLMCCAAVSPAEAAIAAPSPESPAIATVKDTGDDVVRLLQGLPKPTRSPATLPTMFSANAYGQKAINFQLSGRKADELLTFYRDQLTGPDYGYTERTINTTSGAWGFSVVFVPPADFALKPQSGSSTPAMQVGDSLTVHNSGGPQVVLVIQATQLSETSVNINMRYEEI